MAITKVDIIGPPTGAQYVKDTSVGSTAASIATNKRVRALTIDNSQNTSAVYLKLYDATSVTVGTTDPYLVVPVPASTKLSLSFLQDGHTFANLYWACVTTPGTGGTTGPTNPVVVEAILYD